LHTVQIVFAFDITVSSTNLDIWTLISILHPSAAVEVNLKDDCDRIFSLHLDHAVQTIRVRLCLVCLALEFVLHRAPPVVLISISGYLRAVLNSARLAQANSLHQQHDYDHDQN